MGFEKVEYPQPQEDPNEYSFTSEELQTIEGYKAKYPDVTSAVMPTLWLAQRKWGWLPQKVMKLVGDTLGLSFAHVYGVATFYSMYLKENKGKHLIDVCTCFTCGVCGGEALYETLKRKVNAGPDGASEDGMFFVREAECLGACDTAPVIQVDNQRLRWNVDEEQLDQILQKLRNGEALPYERVPMRDQSQIGQE
jgi:NADH-quinone oxidoreductase subunit E